MTDKQILKLPVRDWLTLSRPPFHTVGILPFALGTVLAWRLEQLFRLDVFLLGLTAVILIMLCTYQAGEYFDLREDTISRGIFPSLFAGGSGIMPTGRMPAKAPLYTSIIAFGAAGVIGLVLQFAYHTGPYTLPLGIIGALSGFFYSTPPVRLVEKGVGEAFIGFCYGWLPVAAAFYIQTSHLHPIIDWLSIAIGLSIFNVILINEFHDYEADRQVGKRNLLVRVGKTWGKAIYISFSFISWAAVFLSIRAGVPAAALELYLPVTFISLIIIGLLAAGKEKNRQTLEIMCGLTIVINLGTTASYLWAYWS